MQELELQEELHKAAQEDGLTPEIEAIVDAKVEEMIGPGGYSGYCHLFWSRKKKILLEEYGIKWRTPWEVTGWNFD